MAKQPIVERFKISCETDVTSLGPVMSMLAKIPGLMITGSELVTEVRSFSKNNIAPGFNTQAFVREWVKEHPTFKAKEAVRAVRDTGNGNGSAAYPALKVLTDEGILKKIGDGNYSRTDVKSLAAPKKTTATKVAKKHAPVKHDVSAADFTMRVISRNHGKISSNTLKKHFESDGRAATGTGPVLNRLVDVKKLKRVGEGLYEIARAAPKKTDKPVVTNGSAVEVEVPANG